jgi:aminopeptidase N
MNILRLLPLSLSTILCYSANAAAPLLTQSQAEARFALIEQNGLEYDLKIDLTNESVFYVEETMSFKLSQSSASFRQNLFIDLAGAEIQALMVNGEETRFEYDGLRITFPDSSIFSTRTNTEVSIIYKRPYNTNGRGLHRYQDVSDGKVYIYSNDEPFHFNEIFASFDQPDLKARFKMTVIAPKDHVVVTNTQKTNVARRANENVWYFPKSARISTYLVALISGPFRVWEDRPHRMPVRLLARESLAPYLEKDSIYKDWHKPLRLGLNFLEQKLGYRYPFLKYDQILVPNFVSGAMENVGAVTFNELKVPRTVETLPQRVGRYVTILHELTHQPFGNDSTLKWWNDLWLNESFADLFGYLMVDELASELNLPKKLAWQVFTQRKRWGYVDDALKSTHPIIADVSDTLVARSIFDGISYSKGAAALKQLIYFIGRDKFYLGLSKYLRETKGQNTTRQDFMGYLSEAAGIDLNEWQEKWLKSAGTNTIYAERVESGGHLLKIKLHQEKDSISGLLRPHKMKIGLFNKDSVGKLVLSHVIGDVNYSEELTELTLETGTPSPDLILLNYDDHDFVNIQLDGRSVRALEGGLSTIDDPMTRQLLWLALIDAVKKGELPVQTVLKIFLRHAPHEDDVVVLEYVANLISQLRSYMPASERSAALFELESLARKQFRSTTGDLQIIWFDQLNKFTHSPSVLTELEALLDGRRTQRDFTIDQVRRWKILTTLSRMGRADALQRIAIEASNDLTLAGEKSAILAEIVFPDQARKMTWWKRITAPLNEPGSLSQDKRITAMSGFHVFDQEDLTSFATPAYFEMIKTVATTHDPAFAQSFALLMFPSQTRPEILERSEQSLTETPLLRQVSKGLIQGNYELRQKMKAQSVAVAAAANRVTTTAAKSEKDDCGAILTR